MRAQDKDGERDGLILREFTRQAATFEDPRLNAAFTSHLQRLVDFAQPDPEDVCLDVACGTGLVGRALAVRARHVTALDATPAMLATGKERADVDGVFNVVFQWGDAARLPFLGGSFSLVISRFSLHHVHGPDRVAAEMVRVCRSGGRVVVADMVVKAGLPGDPDRVERLRDPSHGTILGVEAIVGLFTGAGANLETADVFDVTRPLRPWFEQAGTPGDVARQIEEELSSEVAGGAATGLRPLVVDGDLWFTQTWAHVSFAAP